MILPSRLFRSSRAAGLALIAGLALGQVATSAELTAGKKSFVQMCASCHGAAGQGNEAVHAPPLAGQYADYIVRQVGHFKSGVRTGAEGSPATVMQAIAAGTDEHTVLAIAQYLETLKPVASKPTAALPAQVRGVFGVCTGCHNAQAEGIQAMGSPRLNMLPEWYLVAQMRAFKDGSRGRHEQDKFGKQMVSIMADLPDEDVIRDLAIYIQYLDKKAVSKK